MCASRALVLFFAAVAAVQPPNIIWLQGDSIDGRLFDPTDADLGTKLQLQGFTKWVEQGVTFARHYANSPQCVPSRSSMMTGLHVHESLSPNNGQGLAFSTKTGALDSNCVLVWSRAWCRALAARQAAAGVNATILDQAAAQGYELALFGRFDAGAGILDDYAGTTGDGWHDGPELGILARGAAIWGAVDREPWARTDGSDPNPFPNDVYKQQEVLDWIEKRGSGRGAAAAAAAPFFLWLGVMCPHPPYDTNSTWLAHVNASGAFDVPAQLPREATHPYDAYMSNAKQMWALNYTALQVREMRRAYWGAVAEAAILMREVILHASNYGLLENTVVIITSDHGEMGIEHRMDLKSSLREPSTRVPLVVIPFNVPGLVGGGRVVTNLTSHLDIFPTLAELGGGGAPPPPRLKGRSLVPFLRAAPPPPRPNQVALQYHSNYAPCGSYSLRTPEWKLIAFGRVNGTQLPSQLFAVDGDPREMVDVAAANPAVVAALTAALEAELGAPLAAIEEAMLADNLQNYLAVWHATCTGEELVQALVGSFLGATGADVVERVTAWAGVSPRNATGRGGACGVVPND